MFHLKASAACLAAVLLSAIPLPALADVKDGVDAWSRGDYPAAVRQWQGPAAQGDADAMFNLGQAYKLGRGVTQDLVKAEDLFGRAAAQGHLQASDNYGLLLFQRGERARALPFITAASDRGDPRAQYLLGVAHFNGDGVPKDWVRAYALTSLSQQAGLPQAQAAMTQMDQHIPMDQRQQGVALAAELAEQAQATRARQLAAVDLGAQAQPGVPVAMPDPALRPPRAPVVVAAALPQRRPIPSADAAVAAAERVAGSDAATAAGADYARPTRPVVAAVAQRPVVNTPAIAAAPNRAQPAAQQGPWRVQLGAFGVPGNAEALWNRVKGRPELAGHAKIMAPSGSVTRLLAGGFTSQADAAAACSRLKAGGFSCLATRN